MKPSALLILILPLLAGCGAEQHQDIREWMREEAKGMRGKVAPLPEIAAFPVVAYETETLTPPFASGKIVTLEAVADSQHRTGRGRSNPLRYFRSRI